MPKDNTVERNIGKRIQNLRKEKGYTQEHLAEMVGISTNYLSDVERGKSSLRLGKLVSVINVLGCSADDVLMDVIDRGYVIRTSRLSERMESLTPDEQEKAFAVLDAMFGPGEK